MPTRNFAARQSLWLPAIRAGVSFNRHEGPLQTSEGTIEDVRRNALESGLGLGAVAAGSPAVPGITANFRVADAVYQPRIGRYLVAANQQAAAATAT